MFDDRDKAAQIRIRVEDAASGEALICGNGFLERLPKLRDRSIGSAPVMSEYELDS